jgi:hypothetical protein
MKILHAKSIFVGVQVWHLATPLIAFHFVGAFEHKSAGRASCRDLGSHGRRVVQQANRFADRAAVAESGLGGKSLLHWLG